MDVIKEELKEELNIEIIKKYICPLATEQEAYMFLRLCKAQRLNPFLREAYLIKYSPNEPAQIVTGKETFTKRADRIASFDGFEAGIIVLTETRQLIYRKGALLIKGETLLGGWAEVYRKDRGHAYRTEVSIEEYTRRTKTGEITKNWQLMPATMVRKVALVQALREAFPTEFGGLYSPEEMPIDDSQLPEPTLPMLAESTLPTLPAPTKEVQPEPQTQPDALPKISKQQVEAIIRLAAKNGVNREVVESFIERNPLTSKQAGEIIRELNKGNTSVIR